MASSGNFCTMNPIGQVGGSDNTSKIFENGNLQVRNFQYFDATVMGTVGVTSGKWYYEATFENGNLQVRNFQYFDATVMGSIGVRSGKWYYEATFETGNSGSGPAWGWCNSRFNIDAGLSYTNPASATGGDTIHIYADGSPMRVTSGVHNESNSNWADTAANFSTSNIIGIAVDFDNSKAYFSKNGSFTDIRSGQDPANGTNPCLAPSGGLYTWNLTAENMKLYGPWYPAIGNWAAASRTVRVNFGQDSTFQGQISAGGNADENGFGDFKYTPPTGFLALCTGNAPISDDIDPAQTDNDYPGKQFSPIVYTGNASTNAITGLGFKPDLVWIQNYSSQNQTARMQDSSRGVTKSLEPAFTTNEATESGVTAFGTDGFTLGSQQGGYNSSGASYVAWCWRANGGTTASNSEGSGTSTVQANTAAGFSIVQFPNYSGDTTFGHGLTKTPNFIIAKLISGGSNWPTYHDAWSSGKACFLNKDDAEATSSHFAHSGTGNPVSATTFGMGASFAGSGAGIAFVWHSVEGFSKFGKYVGNGNADGPFIYTGFRPKLIYVKLVASAGNWWVQDVGRSTYNPLNKYIAWDSDGGEQSGLDIDCLSNGFKIRTTSGDLNSNGADIAYGAWGDVPFKYNNTF